MTNVVLAFDYGEKRIGVAVGQTLTNTARPLKTLTLKANAIDWDRIDTFIKEWQPICLVVGIPLNMDGTEQPITAKARQFGLALQARSGLPVYGVDERLTTREARSRLFAEGGYKHLKESAVDSVAAQVILETWFASGDSEKHQPIQ